MVKFFYIIEILTIVVLVRSENEWRKNIEDCKNETGLMHFTRHPHYNDPNVKCFHACIEKKHGNIDDDGKINPETFLSHVKDRNSIENETIELELAACVSSANEEDNVCDVVATAYKCILKKIIIVKKQQFKECKEEIGYLDVQPYYLPETESSVTAEAKEELERRKRKCFSACMDKKKGNILNGKINLDKFLKDMKKYHPNTDESFDLKVINCVESANEEFDVCDVADVLHKCIRENLGFHRHHHHHHRRNSFRSIARVFEHLLTI